MYQSKVVCHQTTNRSIGTGTNFFYQNYILYIIFLYSLVHSYYKINQIKLDPLYTLTNVIIWNYIILILNYILDFFLHSLVNKNKIKLKFV